MNNHLSGKKVRMKYKHLNFKFMVFNIYPKSTKNILLFEERVVTLVSIPFHFKAS